MVRFVDLHTKLTRKKQQTLIQKFLFRLFLRYRNRSSNVRIMTFTSKT